MRRLPPTRKILGISAISTAVFVAGAASAWSSPSTTTTTSTSTSTTATGPARYFVLNATANAASDHEIIGSSAFPNYTSGAVDNYYSKAHTHVDNAPFAEGTASPADTGPLGQTAAAGNFQQPQYADARWPGDPPKATYGTQGQPYAVATAADYAATAEASAASSGLSGASGTSNLAVSKGLDGRLRAALAAWKAKWLPRLDPKKPAVTIPAAPAAPVTTPSVTVTTPTVTLGNVATLPSVTVPAAVPSGLLPKSASSRSLQSSSPPPDGATLLHSTSRTVLDPTSDDLVTSGESSLGRVSIGGGQIVLEGIHVTAQITNDGTPSDKESISVASASIGGIPVTIDDQGVHVAGQGQGLPYQQASDALNGALKTAGIQVFLVSPEVVHGGAGNQGGSGPTLPIGSSTTTPDTTTTDTTTTDTTTTDTMSTDTTTTDQSSTTSSLTGTCSPTATGGTGTTATGTTGTTTTAPTTTGTGPVIPIGSGSGGGTGTDPTSTTSTTDTTGATDDTSSEETVTATGVHVVFTQPVDTSGVPAQYVEHILGEVYVDSLAVPAGNLPDLSANLGLGLDSGSGFGSSSGSCGTAGRRSVGKRTTKPALGSTGGSSSSGGSTPSGPAPASSGFTSGSSQPTSGVLGSSTGEPVAATGAAPSASPMGFLSTLKKPLWLLVIYLVWQVLMLVTGASVWRWYRGGTS